MKTYYIINKENLQVLETFQDKSLAVREFGLLDCGKYALGSSERLEEYQDKLIELYNNEPKRTYFRYDNGNLIPFAKQNPMQQAIVKKENHEFEVWGVLVKKAKRNVYIETLKAVVDNMTLFEDEETTEVYISFRHKGIINVIDFSSLSDNYHYKITDKEFKEFVEEFDLKKSMLECVIKNNELRIKKRIGGGN